MVSDPKEILNKRSCYQKIQMEPVNNSRYIHRGGSEIPLQLLSSKVRSWFVFSCLVKTWAFFSVPSYPIADVPSVQVSKFLSFVKLLNGYVVYSQSALTIIEPQKMLI